MRQPTKITIQVDTSEIKEATAMLEEMNRIVDELAKKGVRFRLDVEGVPGGDEAPAVDGDGEITGRT